MIAFDSVALLLEPAGPELQHWLEMYRPKRDWCAFLPPPDTQHDRHDRMEFNKLVVPTGARRWSFMIGLASNGRLRDITDRLGLTTGNSPARDYLPKTLEFGQFDAGTPPFNYSRIPAYMLQPRPMTFSWREYGRHNHLDKDPYRDLYALPIVDERWAWQHIYVDESDYNNAPIENLDDQIRYVWSVLAKTDEQLKILVSTPATQGTWDDLTTLPVCELTGFARQSAAQLLDELTEPLGMRLVPSVSDPGVYYLLSGIASAEIHRRSMDLNQRFRVDPNDATQYQFMADDPIPIVCGGNFVDMPTASRNLSGQAWLAAAPARASVAYGDGTIAVGAEDLGYVGLEYRVHAPLSSPDAAYSQFAHDGVAEHVKHMYDWTFSGHRPQQLTSLDSVATYSYERCNNQYTGVSRLVSRLPNDHDIPLVSGDRADTQLVPFMVSCYLGNGWYEVYKLDMDPPDLPANQVIDETTGQTRIVQPWAGHTTWQLLDLIAPSGNWTNIEADGEGTSQTPDAQNYPGIQVGDTVVTDNELTAGQNYGLCIPECYASQCTWEWQTDNWIRVAQADCETEQGGDDPNSPGSYVHGGCSCQVPAIPDPVPDNGTQVVTACAASDCSAETPPDATWEWQGVAPATHFGDFTPYWKLVDDCGNPDPAPDGRCRAVPPNTDGTSDGETITVQCYPSGLCSYVTENNDPIDLCCDELIADPDYVPRQEGHKTDPQQVSPDTYGDPVKAFSIDKMTQPGSFDLTAAPGTYGFMLPLKSGQFDPDINEETNWGIVQWQRTLIKASIPTAIQCCPTSGGGTEIKITAWTDMIVEGLYCGGQTEPCEV